MQTCKVNPIGVHMRLKSVSSIKKPFTMGSKSELGVKERKKKSVYGILTENLSLYDKLLVWWCRWEEKSACLWDVLSLTMIEYWCKCVINEH